MATKRKSNNARVRKVQQQRTKVSMSQAPGFSAWQHGLLSVVSFIAAYIFASLAIDSGSLWHYLMCIMSTYVAIRFLVLTVKAFGKKSLS